jgi:hypothetical protein
MNIKIPITALLLCGALNLHSQSKADFRLNLNMGQCFTVVEETKTEGTSTVQGKTSDIYSSVMYETEYKVTRKVKGGVELAITKKNFVREMQNAVLKGSKQSPELADEYNIYNPSTISALQLNRPYIAIISDNGKVLKIKNLNNLVKDAKKKIEAIKDKESKQLYLSMLPTEQALAESIEDLTSFFPETPVAVGDKWSIYEFSEETDSTYIIKGYRTLYENGESRKDTIMGNILETTGTGSEEIVIEVDKKSGLPRYFQINSASDVEVIIKTMEGNEIMRMPKTTASITTTTIKPCKNE